MRGEGRSLPESVARAPLETRCEPGSHCRACIPDCTRMSEATNMMAALSQVHPGADALSQENGRDCLTGQFTKATLVQDLLPIHEQLQLHSPALSMVLQGFLRSFLLLHWASPSCMRHVKLPQLEGGKGGRVREGLAPSHTAPQG